MALPFSRDEFFAVFAAYNTSFWPVAVLLWLSTASVFVHGWRRSDIAPAIVFRFLALHWAWVGIAYHLLLFTAINPAAWIFGGFFVLQAAVFWSSGKQAAGNRLWARRRVAGTALTIYALLYPAITVSLGHAYPAAPTFGLPCPTTLLTAGLLLTHCERVPWTLVAVPIAWAMVASAAAWLFDVRADFALPFAAAALAALAWRSPQLHPIPAGEAT